MLTTFLIWHGNRFLRTGELALARLETVLTAPIASRRLNSGDGLDFVTAEDGRRCFADWISVGRAQGVRRLLMAPGGELMVERDGGFMGCYSSQTRRGNASTLTPKDLANFVEGSGKSAELHEALLWQNRVNFRYHPGDDWDGFVEALSRVPPDEITGLMDLTIHHVDFSGDVLKAWERLRSARRARPATQVEYAPVEVPANLGWPRMDVQEGRLRPVLEQLVTCCTEHGDIRWSDHFRGCLTILRDGPPQGSWLMPIIEGAEPSERAIALYACAWESHVFGGMGSFNDTRVKETQCGRRLSEALYAEIFPSLVAATNDGASPEAVSVV